jgi:hypothetical protein
MGFGFDGSDVVARTNGLRIADLRQITRDDRSNQNKQDRVFSRPGLAAKFQRTGARRAEPSDHFSCVAVDSYGDNLVSRLDSAGG